MGWKATAVADVLGHSPGMLMKVYAHALPESTRAIADQSVLAHRDRSRQATPMSRELP